MDKLKDVLPANRVAAIVGFLTMLGAALTTLETSFLPGSPPAEAIGKGVALLASLAGAAKIVDRFLEGSHKWDAIQADLAKSGLAPADDGVLVDVAGVGDDI